MNEIYAINAGKLKILERKNKELERKVEKLSIEVLVIQFENSKLKKVLEKFQANKKESI